MTVAVMTTLELEGDIELLTTEHEFPVSVGERIILTTVRPDKEEGHKETCRGFIVKKIHTVIKEEARIYPSYWDSPIYYINRVVVVEEEA